MAILELTKENFEEEVLKSEKPVLIDFWASWCMPCKMMSPVFDEVAEEKNSEAKFCKVNVDKESEIAAKYNVMSIPTFVLIKDGKELDRTVGVQEKHKIARMLSQI